MARGVLRISIVKLSLPMAVISALLLSACIIDTVPLPEGHSPRGPGRETDGGAVPGGIVGIVDSALYTAGTDSPILLIGAEGAMDPGAKVRVINPSRSNWLGEAEVAGDGSFNLPVNASVGESIEVSELLDDMRLQGLTLVVQPPSADAYSAQGAFAEYVDNTGTDPANADLGALGAVVVYPPDSTGNATVVGTAAAGMVVVIANLSLGNSTAVLVTADGSFVAHLVASSGQELGLFAVEPAASNAGPAPINVVVP
jgi:hypothetical protein